MLDKNGCNPMAIYCWECSNERHEEMNKKEGKGYCKLIETRVINGVEGYKFQCNICDVKTMWSDKRYVEDYAIR